MIRRAILLAAAMNLAALPAFAQERPIIQYPPTGSSPTPTPTPGTCDLTATTYETIVSGLVVNSAGSNAEGTFVTLGTATAELNAIEVIAAVGTTTYRGLVDIYIGGTTPKVDDWYIAQVNTHRRQFPVNIPAGSQLQLRWRAGSSNAPATFTVIGQRRGAGCAAGYSRVEAINADLATTRAGDAEVPLNNVWTQIVAATSTPYVGLIVNGGVGSTQTSSSNQTAAVQIGTGASGAETVAYSLTAQVATSATQSDLRMTGGVLFMGSVPSGTRFSTRITANTNPGDSGVRVGLMGVVN